MKKLLFFSIITLLLVGLMVPMAVPVIAQPASDTLYGIMSTGAIHAVDPIAPSYSSVDTTENCPTEHGSGPNGLAYDQDLNRMYYTEYPDIDDGAGGDPDGQTSLYFSELDDPDPNETFAGFIPGEVACGDIYQGNYYYIAGGQITGFTDDLYRVEFFGDGTVDDITKVADISGDAHSYGFWGDIAIWDGTIYGIGRCFDEASITYEFFTVEINGNGFSIITTVETGLQLAFGESGELYGHVFGTGDFYTVDTSDGTLTYLFTAGWSDSEVRYYTDLASGSTSTETYSICGYKYADWEDQEIPLPGWTIHLEISDGEGGWDQFASTVTDGSGKYCFEDLFPGDYRVSEDLKDGWDQVSPEGGYHCFSLPGGETYSEDGKILYGSQRNNNPSNGLYEIDLEAGISTRLFNAGGSNNSPNALGFDPVNERLYYMNVTEPGGPSTLYFYDIQADTSSAAGLSYADEVIVGASFYEGAYYYIPNKTADLHKVTLHTDGTVVSDDILWGDFNGDNPAIYRFGDFAINSSGMLYASTNGTLGSTAEFFKLDVATGDYTLISLVNTLGLQLSFGSDGTLYAHSAGTGEFFTVDLLDGSQTSAGYVESDKQQQELFSDLASGTQPQFYDFHNTPTLYCFDETAWAAEGEPGATRFVDPPGNWATYIDYMVGDGTEGDPVEYPLFSGQTYYSGDLLVWDEAGILYLQYVASGEDGEYAPEGYCGGSWAGLTEFHLQVVEETEGFNDYRTYSKKKGYGAPIPGSFDETWEGTKISETDVISVVISEPTQNTVFIAAHAVMWWCGYDCNALAEITAALE